MDYIDRIRQIESDCLTAIHQVKLLDELLEVDLRFLSKKGAFSELLKTLRDIPPEQRPQAGACANEAKRKLEEAISTKRATLEKDLLDLQLKTEKIDVTLPSRKIPLGSLHPVTQVMNSITGIFRRLGFELSSGPEIETEFYNFDALNMPKEHPARDMQDTFYLPDSHKPGVVLRTQTSPVQIRTMRSHKPPIRILSPGAVFRSDSDITHSPMFHQVEGLYVDKAVSFAELKGCLLFFAREMFGPKTELRLRPSYFPFVEPGAEADVTCMMCKGAPEKLQDGCRVCKNTGWLEILGAGMVHPKVFQAVGYDPSEVTGFAFGMGVERIAMLKYGIPDLRFLFENDIRFLKQFGV